MAASGNDIERYRRNWQNEVDSAAQYRELERLETNSNKAQIYAGLAQAEERHIEFWEKQLRAAAIIPPPRKPSWRSLCLIRAAKWFGPAMVLPTLQNLENASQNVYRGQRETLGTGMPREERQHAIVLQRIDRIATAGVEGSFLGRIEGRHRSVGGNALRASILGVNDGLCSNLSLIMGVFGLETSERGVLLTGIAGLLAGALSMALGEWLSVSGARELAEREIQTEADELSLDPSGEREELKLIYEGKGLTSAEAHELSEKMISDPERALDALTREELGLDPQELGGNPLEAAGFSFALFAVGAAIPLLPLTILSGGAAMYASLAAGAGGLYLFGALTTIFTGKAALRSGLRQMTLGLLAAGLTYGLGELTRHFL